MATQSSLIENRTIRVFISSTFSDMNDERTELMKKTFPRLRVMAAKRDVTLTEVDLRWGITKEESESGKVVDICLREIQNSIPFFIGIIGNRYGWIPSSGDIDESTFDRFDQVRSYVERKLSVTDMEMQFGVLEHKDDLHAFFYINDNKEERDNNPEKLAELKRAVRSNGRYPVSDFSSPEDLAKQVEEAFVRLLDELFPEKHSLSFLEKERISQRSFLNQLCQSYVPVKENFDKLDNFLSDENQQYLIVTGESGLGKSALVANWVKRLLDKKHTNRKILYHFIGNGGSLGSHHHVVKTLCAELKDQFKLEPPFDERDKEKWSKEDTDTLELIYNQISVDKEGCLIVLDAVNQLVDMDNAKNMLWLCFPPCNVKVLITTLKEDVTMDVFNRREYPVLELKPLGIRQRRKLVIDYLKDSYGKQLAGEHITIIVSDKQSSNTLVLRTLLDELVSFGSFVDLENRIQYYLEPDSIPDFYQRVLARLEDDFGSEIASHVLSLILLSREGLPEDAIIEITELKPLHWSQIYCSLISHLTVKMGLVNFSHRYFSDAVQQRYLESRIGFERSLREEIVGYYNQHNTNSSWSELGFQYEKLGDNRSLYALLMRADTFLYFYENDVDSLTRWWNLLLADSSGTYRLDNYLEIETHGQELGFKFIMYLSEFASRRCANFRLSLKFAKKGLEYTKQSSFLQSEVLNSIGLSYSMMGNHRKALDYFKRALRIRLSIIDNNHLLVTQLYDNIGLEYRALGNPRMALSIFEKVLGERLSFLAENTPEVACSYSFVGHSYLDVGDNKKALYYIEKSLSIRLLLFGANHSLVAESYDGSGVAYGRLKNHLKAQEYFEKSLEIRLFLFGNSNPSVACSYNNIGVECNRQGKFKEALSFFEKALEIRMAVYGGYHPYVADSYNSIGNCYGYMGDNYKALFYKEKALKIRKAVLGENHLDVASSYNDIGVEYGRSRNHKLALECFEKALKIRLGVLGENNSIVATSYFNIGIAQGRLNNPQMALTSFEKALNIRLSVLGENDPDVFITYYNAGLSCFQLNDFSKALQLWLKAIGVTDGSCDKKMMASLLYRIGCTNKLLGDIDNANEYFCRAAEKWKELGNEEQAQKSLSEIVENK